MPTVISVEHLSKNYRLGQIGTPSESTRPFAMLRMLREGERPACFDTLNTTPSRADLEIWRAKMRDEQTFMDTV